MLDANIIRQNPEMVRKSLNDRMYSTDLLDGFLATDIRWRETVDKNNRLKQVRNNVSMEIAGLSGDEKQAKIGEMKGLSDEIKALDAEISKLDAERQEALLLIPNLAHSSVPVGKSADDNVMVKTWMKEKTFPFRPKEHFEIGEDLDIIDFVRGAKVAGSGYYVLKGDGARLERALINFMLDLHNTQGYREVFPPILVNDESATGTGQLPKMRDDMYHVERDGLWLNPTAEVPVTNLHRDEIFESVDLPVYYTAYLPSFRREAGRHSDTRGIARVHQFNKVEMVKFVHPDHSYEELESLLLDAESVIQALELPYRVLLLCTGDMSFHAAKCYDIELHAPGGDRWLEASSCSNFTDFQARRARIKYRPEPHLKSEFLHTLNGSGVALPRTMVAILENYQNEDGTVTVPKVLRPYMQGQEIIG